MRSVSISRIARLPLVGVAVLAVLLALPGTSHAQRFTGELSGTVVDESGAVIPGADVTLTNEASGSQRRTVTNSDGFFGFSAVPAATYSVSITIQGFKTHEVKGIPLRAGDARSLRTVRLEVATMAETVSVTAEAALTPLTSGERSATLVADQIENIPIVSSSAAELLRVLPGLTPVTQGATNRPGFTGEVIGINGNGEYQGGGGNNQSAIGNFSANGTRTQTLDITLDGAPGSDPGCNCATSVNPNTEMVQEFKVLQSNFGADQAKGPNSMTVITKQGGRDFHGSLFAYFRDYHLNSNEWFGNKIGTERVKNKFIYPGGTLSGPLKQDKIFFFVGYEYYKQRLDTGFVKSWVPTQAMRNGDFSQAASLGLSGSYVNKVPNGYPNGVIPSSQFDPGGQALLNILPLPNADPAVTGGFNYVDNLLVDQPNHQALARIDFNLSDTTKMFLRYNLQRETQPFVIGLWWRNGARQVPYPSAISAANASDSATVSLTHVFDPSLTSETIFGMTYIDFPNAFEDRSKISRSALGYPYQGVFGQSNDQIPSVDWGNWGDNGPLLFNPGGFDPVLYATKWQFNFSENVTKVWGTHTAKVGFYFERITNTQPGNANSNGFMILNGAAANGTGNTFANLLLGTGLTHYDEATQNVLHDIAWNRWEAYANDSWKVKPNVTLTYGARFSILAPWTDRQGNGLAAFDLSRYSASAPASDFPGVVWHAKDSSVPVEAVDTSFLIQPRVGFAWDVKNTGSTVLRGGFGVYYYHDAQGPYADLVDFGAGLKNFSRDNDAGFTLRSVEGLGGGAAVFNGSTIDITDDKQPKTYSWSLTVNQKLPWSMSAEVGYVGNKSTDQMNFDIANYNAVRPDGTRPLPQYGNLNVFHHSAFQNYHGLQTLIARQRGAFNFTLAYTFSKALGIRSGIGGNQAVASEYLFPNNYRDINYGVLSNDRTHVATASYSWVLPGPKTGGFKEAALGGWQVAGISSYVSGAPLPIVNNSNFDIQGTLADGRSITSTLINGTPDIRVQPVVTCDPTSNVPDGYFVNPSCFAAPSPGANGSYNLPYIKGQAYFNHDLALFKNFSLGKGAKKLQLRINAYNVFNHPIAFPDNGANLTLRFVNGQNNDPNFGKIPESNKFGRRIVQLALRFQF
jgi:Carboxypeptidase regulatory-like domain